MAEYTVIIWFKQVRIKTVSYTHLDYDGMMDLMVAGRSQREILDSIPFYRENKLVQEALKRVEQYIEEKPLNIEKTKSQKRREDMSL